MKISIKYYVLSIAGICSFLFSIFVLHAGLINCPVFAAESTPSAKTASTSATLTEKIEAIKKEVASRAAVLKKEVSKKQQNKAFLGKIMQKTATTITLETGKGKKIVVVNEYTEYSSKIKTQKTKIDLSNLATDDYLAALGDLDDKGQLVAKRVIKLPETKVSTPQIIWGQVIAVNDSSLEIKAKDKKNIKILTTANTRIALGNSEATIKDANVGRYLVSLGLSKNEEFSAKLIYIIPAGASLKSKVATSSAIKGATSSATTSAKKK